MAGVEHDAVGEEQRVAQDLEPRVSRHEFRVGRLNPGEVQLASGERRQLGGRLVHDDNDQALEPRGAAERGGKVRAGGKDPAPVGLVRHEPERPVPHGGLVPRRLSQASARNGVEQVCREYGVRYSAHPTFLAGVRSHYRWLRRMGRPDAG